ncbi:class I tRNA ligase family protein [Coralliovum pocilloporae]|uniref:class I tRNA ligase family protein n=1 Tax=Coralliovum pocilloporae TaxID=3066369 RepID=UPI003306CE8F
MLQRQITTPPPTPNGDLHVGHLAGPYLAADVFFRSEELAGRTPSYHFVTDDNQSYVQSKALERGITPASLIDSAFRSMLETMASCNLRPALVRQADDYIVFIQDFFTALFETGAVARKSIPVLLCPETNVALFEANVSGSCPTCLAVTAGGICETCGHPNLPSSLVTPSSKSSLGKAPIEAEMEIYCLELERYRSQLANLLYNEVHSRPSLDRLMRQLLSKPLADFPLTFPSTWGIPAPFPGAEGQVLNPWGEIYAGQIYALERGSQRSTRFEDVVGRLNTSPSGSRLVQFLGFDNSYFYGIVHPSIAFAMGEKFPLPAALVTNEFYELDGSKFSTSKDHLIWAKDISAKYDIDFVRLYLARTNPSCQITSFSQNDFENWVQTQIIAPLEVMYGLLSEVTRDVRNCVASPSPATRRAIDNVCTHMVQGYQLEQFELRHVAETFERSLQWAAERAVRPKGTESSQCIVNFSLLKIGEAIQPLCPTLGAKLAAKDPTALSWKR